MAYDLGLKTDKVVKDKHKKLSFSQRVYKAVSTIPLGEVRTYKWVAKKAGSPGAWRAAGEALKKNPYPLIIPCHRVIKSDGSVGGYAFGGERAKQFIIDFEQELVKQ